MSSVLVADGNRDFVSYIPPINRSVVQELDRSLRDTLKVFSQNRSAEQNPAEVARDITGSVDAVERAASLIGSMASRIRDLEKRVDEAEAQRLTLSVERDKSAAQATTASEKLAAETERRSLAEALATEHEAYSKGLESDLAAAQADIERLTAVIAQAFGSIKPMNFTGPSFKT
jgi:septal ring factor EnvC (AmiA/AmiB activator)